MTARGMDTIALFDVEEPPAAEGDDQADGTPKVVRCSECGHVLRSKKSKDAGVSQRCAATVGVAVLATMRRADRARRAS